MGMQIILTRGLHADLLALAAREAPREACGLLLGPAQEGGIARVASLLPAANVHPDPERFFEIDPAVLIAATRAARQGGPHVLGCYHSHPSGVAAPSATDAAMAAHDGKLWAIVAADAITWWRDGPDGFEALSSPDQRG